MDDEIEMDNFVLESAPKEGRCVALNDVHSSKKEDSLTLSYGRSANRFEDNQEPFFGRLVLPPYEIVCILDGKSLGPLDGVPTDADQRLPTPAAVR